MRAEFEDFIKIIRTVLKQDAGIPKLISSKQTLYQLVKAHNMEIMLYYFLIRAGISIPRERYNLLVYKHLLKVQAYEAITKKFEENEIRYMPLKGIRMCSLYPKQIIRQMHDIDILVDKENLDKVRRIFEKEGYTYSHSMHHDKYVNEDGVLFEIHESLSVMENFCDIFKNPWENTVCNGMKYEFIPEYEYLYILAHFCSHITFDGVKLYGLIDMWLFEESHRDLDFIYINRIAQQCNVERFVSNVRKLKGVWLYGEPYTDIYKELTEYMLGVSESIKNTTVNSYDTNQSRIRNFINILKHKAVLDKKEMALRYPWAKGKILLAYAHCIRWIYGLIYRRKYISDMFDVFLKVGTNDIRMHQKKLSRFGINIEKNKKERSLSYGEEGRN